MPHPPPPFTPLSTMGDDVQSHPYWLIFLTLSNLPAWWSAWAAWKLNFKGFAVIFFSSGFVSIFYHIANSLDITFGLTETAWGRFDFFLAFSAFNVGALFVARFQGKAFDYLWSTYGWLSLVTFGLVMWDRTAYVTLILVVVNGLAVIAVKFYLCDGGIPKDFDWRDFGGALLWIFLGLGFFILGSQYGDDDPHQYWYLHSLWHIFIYGSFAFSVVNIYNPYRYLYFMWLNKKTGKWDFRWYVSDKEQIKNYYLNPTRQFTRETATAFRGMTQKVGGPYDDIIQTAELTPILASPGDLEQEALISNHDREFARAATRGGEIAGGRNTWYNPLGK